MSCPMWDKESQTACLLGKKNDKKTPKLKQTKKKEKTQGRLCRNSEVVHKSRLSPLGFAASTTSGEFVSLRCFRSCVVFKLSSDLKYCSCAVASPPSRADHQADVPPLDPQRCCTCFLQHSSSWYICSSSSWDSRCSRRSVRPLMISSGVFMNLQNTETRAFLRGLSFYPHQLVETPELPNSQDNLCCILPKPWYFPASPQVSSLLHTLKGNKEITSLYPGFLKAQIWTKLIDFS